MRALTRDLLAYARLDKEASAAEPVDLDTVAREALDALAGPLRDRRAVVDVADLPTVRGDELRLRQFFQNLIANAIKFTDGDRAPRVTVTAEVAAEAIITVRDKGIGFAPGQAEVIFRPFHRLHSADRFEGTGIGLAVCQKIVEQHGGRIWAEGDPGEGAAFSFALPVASTGPAGCSLDRSSGAVSVRAA